MTESSSCVREPQRGSFRIFLGGCAAAAMAVMLVDLPAYAASRGLQFTPDGLRVLANKDIADERWAIALNDDGTVTGNVFRTDGGTSAFVACDPLAGDNAFACFGADPCSDESGVARGIQRTPDGKRVLVSKDVGTDRWAITLNDDGTVTGNVFRAGGGEPAFLSCEPSEVTNTFACFGADACNSEPCADLFSFIGDATLPPGFFDVPASCDAPFGFLANVTLPEDFFQLLQADDVVSSIITGDGVLGVIRVGAAPIPGRGALSPITSVVGDINVRPGGTNTLNIIFGSAAAASAGAVLRDAQSNDPALVVAIGDEACEPADLVTDWFEIPLDTVSGQLDVSLTFSEKLGEGAFVLCITTIDDGVVGKYFVVQQTVGEPPPTPDVDGPCLDVIVDIAASDDLRVAVLFITHPEHSLSIPNAFVDIGDPIPPETAEHVTFLMPFDQIALGIASPQVNIVVAADDSFPPGDVVRLSFDCFVGVPPPALDDFTCAVAATGSDGSVDSTCSLRVASP